MAYDRIISFRPDSAANWATNNPVLNQGEGAVETDTGYIKIGDGSTAFASLGYITPEIDTYDLTSASATHTFPAVKFKGQVCDVFWSNGGTYTLTLAVSNSETIGGLTASTWTGEGDGHIRVISDGTNWQVVEYEDASSDMKWVKRASGELLMTWTGVGNYDGYENTLPHQAISTSYYVVGTGGTRDWSPIVDYTTKATTAVTMSAVRHDGSDGGDIVIDIFVHGAWK